MVRGAILSAGIAALLGSAQTMAAASPVVATSSGHIAGVSEGAVEVFRGIPYAAPPVGPLRWRSPVPPARWRGIRSAATFGPNCPQPHVPAPYGAQGPQSEDCLTLNIWRPTRTQARRLPVMVWIHGGAFVLGSGSQPLYEGAALARRGVLLVTLNYRLGALGFLTHPVLSREQQGRPLGNYGLLDQIAALRWVRRNIAAFGGDPANVTIMGESAGGVSVQALMASPMARGLFHKAVSQSGGSAGLMVDARSSAAATAGERWAAASGSANATAEEMRALPVERILAAPFLAFPRIDGVLLRRTPAEAFARGEEAPVPLIVGANSFEGSLGILNDAMAQAALGEHYGPLLKAYAAAVPDGNAARARLRGELFFVQPARFIAERHARRGAPSWLYHFDMVPASQRGVLPGAPHGGELAYLFGTPDGFLTRWDEQDRALSGKMADYWVRFVRTGDPNGDGVPTWTPAARAGEALRFGSRIEMLTPTTLDRRTAEAMLAAMQAAWDKDRPGAR